MKSIAIIILFVCSSTAVSKAENGYDLWLRYHKIENKVLAKKYLKSFQTFSIDSQGDIAASARRELQSGIKGLLGSPIKETDKAQAVLVLGHDFPVQSDTALINNEGYVIRSVGHKIYLSSKKEVGLLYGVFHLLRLLQTRQSLNNLNISSSPAIAHRILNHWDNPNRTVERGYAGISIWNWHTLPEFLDTRYMDYARANASVGINGTVVSNVNANAIMLTASYLVKLKSLADLFRQYGIRVYLTARFSAPVDIGGLPTADPLDNSVRQWWKDKANEIYNLIPDFGGFLVKANSEGQPGPQTYNRTHAEGANMLADALHSHGGIVIWRAFVYDLRVQKQHENFERESGNDVEQIASSDRFKQAYLEFKPLDGLFKENVILQVKNGPIDFQPREPFSPLFGTMKKTPLAMEFQITQEYLGQGTHLVFEAPLFKEVLDADTYAEGEGSTVAHVVDGSVYKQQLTLISGVSNIGNAINWTGHPFGQANWYAFGRLAWDHQTSAEQIAREWIMQTFSHAEQVVQTITGMMLSSREAVVNYMTPLGLHHIMATGHHYGPAPWVNNLGRADWNPVYYHQADSMGIGFDRTSQGSNALAQYMPEVAQQWADVDNCDEKYLLWFHHVSWHHRMKNGNSLWNELCMKYQEGVNMVRRMQQEWKDLHGIIDEQRHRTVSMYLTIQEKEAVWWRNACLLYFQSFSHLPFPVGVEKPDHALQYYKNLQYPFAPGIGGNN